MRRILMSLLAGLVLLGMLVMGDTCVPALAAPLPTGPPTLTGVQAQDMIAAAPTAGASAGGSLSATRTRTPTPTRTATRTPTPTRTATVTPTPTFKATPTAGEVWRPAQTTTWQLQLTGQLDLSIDAALWNIDLFDTQASVVATLHGQGRKVVCYISAGTWENWRPDAGDFPDSVLGNDLDGWAGERWLDIRQLDVLGPIMEARLDLCKSKGFDGADFDNVDGYENSTGFPLRYSDQIAYNTWLANAARERGLAVGLKNDLDQVTDLEPSFDFAIVEQCFEYGECDKALPFIGAGKAVFEVEYSGTLDSFCPEANAMGLMSMKKHLSLDAWRQPCSSSGVGGVAELPGLAGASVGEAGAPAGGSGWSTRIYAALAVAAAAVVVCITSAGWYTRRRWVR